MVDSPVVDARTVERTSDRVLVEGAKIFRERGYAASTTRELAVRLGINKASLYYHFAKKEDLLYSICIESMRRIYEDVSTAVESEAEPEQKVQALIRAHIFSTLTDIDMHATMMLEMKSLSGVFREEVQNARDRYEGLVGATISAAQRAGALRHDMTAKHIRMLLLNLLNWTLTWFEPGQGMTPEKLSDLSYDFFINGAGPSEVFG
jgi:TetR/AcrR family transcriptional regulator, cholesterol catabolism regulator